MIDTIRIAERLSEGGVFTEDQAKRIAMVRADQAADELVTKADRRVAVAELKAEMAGLRGALFWTQAAMFVALSGVIAGVAALM